MDSLEFMMELDISHCLVLKNMILFTIELDILTVLHIFFITIMQKSKVDSFDSLPIEKALILHNVIILIKSVHILRRMFLLIS